VLSFYFDISPSKPNQSTEKPTNGAVLHKRKMSSLAGPKCTAAVDKESLKHSNWGYAYANGFVVLSEGLHMFNLRAIATGANIDPSGNLSTTKRTFVGWLSWD
jgi:hypothetical protein